MLSIKSLRCQPGPLRVASAGREIYPARVALCATPTSFSKAKPTMRIEQSIREKLLASFAPAHLEVHNDSHGHNVPKGSESHFRVVIVSESFAGQGRVARQREVNRVLAEELAGGVHALQMETWTPGQWAERGGMTVGPPECRGGMAAERRMQAAREGEEG